MKTWKSILITISILFIIILSFGTTSSKAALQANGNTPAQKDLGTWMSSIRDMEATGGTLGLSETKSSDLLSTSGSNNLDVHMEKNSEYGAMAILSASSYGKQTPVGNGETTTGNKSGVVINLNKEWVSAGTVSNCANYNGADSRYKDIYSAENTNQRKSGDTLLETKGWHLSQYSIWLSNSFNSGILRSYVDSIFSFYAFGNDYGYYSTYANVKDAGYRNLWSSRACVVVGSEL